MKLNDAQSALLARIREADTRFKHARMVEHEAARRAADERIEAKLIERNKLAAQGAEAGIPLAQIGKRGLDTSNHGQVREAISHGSRYLAAEIEPVAETTGPYRWDAARGVLTVAMSVDELTPYAALLARTPDESGETWEFDFDNGRLLPVNPDDDETWMNPVVQVVMTEQNKADAIAYIETRTKVTA